MDLKLQCIKQKTSALIRAYIRYYPITPTAKNMKKKLNFSGFFLVGFSREMVNLSYQFH